MQVDMSKELSPIYEFWRVPFWQATWFYALVITSIILLFIFIIWVLIKKYFKKKKKEAAWECATRELRALKKLVWDNKISPQGFYLSLTEIVKNYLFNRYGYDLFGQTDQEVLLFLEEQKFNPELLESMREMFDSMQLIKFANESTVKEVIERDLAKSFDLVQKTVPKDVKELKKK